LGTNAPTHMSEHELQLDVLPKATTAAFLKLANSPILENPKWYLAGDTALALQVGHRESVDLDFFTDEKTFDIVGLERSLVTLGGWVTSLSETGTLYGSLDGAKISFIAYPFFKPSGRFIVSGGIRILPVEDIATMKIIAISQRGRKRDFVDLFWYCKNRETLETIFERIPKQYPQEHNFPHFIKSLTYFVDAEDDKMPKNFFNANWEEIKNYFRKEVPAVSKRILHLE